MEQSLIMEGTKFWEVLRSRQTDFYDNRQNEYPPIPHREETFLAPTHPPFARFARLTRQQEKRGLLDDSATIGTRTGWQTRFLEKGLRLARHRGVRNR